MWPPPYTIRRSPRARYIRLHVTRDKGVEIIIPSRASIREGLNFLGTKRSWIEKHLSNIQQEPNTELLFPTEINLQSLNRVWAVDYHQTDPIKKVNLNEMSHQLLFTGFMPTFSACLPTFNQWLRHQAHQYLPQWLSQVSLEIQLPFNRVSIRSQKTLWGSCNRDKNISLNDRLLFLPYELVRYVMVHELCHTKYFGHGKRFWQLVGRFDPNYKCSEKNLRHASLHIPPYFTI